MLTGLFLAITGVLRAVILTVQSHRWDKSYKDLRVGTVITKPTAQITNSTVEICGHQKKQKRKLPEKNKIRILK